MLASKDQSLLVWWDSFFFFYHGLDVSDGVTWINFQFDSFA
jgi:hypothetical protein